MIDEELVHRKLLLIVKDMEPLQELASMGQDAFLGEVHPAVLAERYVERIVGRMIDVNYHLLTESGQAPPSDYYQSFVDLATLGVCERVFARRIASCAGLRNRIAHEYDEIDPAKLYEAIQAAARDVPEYIRLVGEWLAARRGVGRAEDRSQGPGDHHSGD